MWSWSINIPVLGQHIHCWRVVGAVSSIQSLHLWHEVEKEASHPLLALWKPVEIKSLIHWYTQNKKQTAQRIYDKICLYGAMVNVIQKYKRWFFSLDQVYIQHSCNTVGSTLDVPLLIVISEETAAVRLCVRGGTNLVHSSRDWTSICWKVLISSRLPIIRATSELLSLDEKENREQVWLNEHTVFSDMQRKQRSCLKEKNDGPRFLLRYNNSKTNQFWLLHTFFVNGSYLSELWRARR